MPSNKILEAKKQIVEALAAKLQTAQAGVLVKYEGITVADDTALRAALRKARSSVSSATVMPSYFTSTPAAAVCILAARASTTCFFSSRILLLGIFFTSIKI